MNITQLLQENDRSLKLVKESEYSGSVNAKDFSAFNSGGVEVEVGEFLYAMVRLLKPQAVLETGTHLGISTSYMASALKENGFGQITTTEFLPENHARANHRFEQLGLQDWIDSCLVDTKELYKEDKTYQLILLDTEPETRFEELVQFYNQLEEGGYLFIHDLPRNLCQGNTNTDHPEMKSWPFGDIPPKMRQLVKDDKLRPFHLPNPRSMMGFYKPMKEDYKW